jgi:hypothetical protein
MSLKEKIREQAKFAFTIYQDYEETRTARMNPNERKKLMSQKFVSVDVVSGLLDKAIEQINQIMCEDYWTCNVHLNKVREKILTVLGVEGETKK